MAKATISCPVCKTKIQVFRPDSTHSFWSTTKPEKDEGIEDFIEQVIECQNPSCASKFSVYWFSK